MVDVRSEDIRGLLIHHVFNRYLPHTLNHDIVPWGFDISEFDFTSKPGSTFWVSWSISHSTLHPPRTLKEIKAQHPWLNPVECKLWLERNQQSARRCEDDLLSRAGSTNLAIALSPGLKLFIIDSFRDFLEMWCRFKGSGWSPPSPISKFKPTSSEKFFFWEWLRANGYAGVGKTEDGVTETDKGGSWIRPAPCPYILYGWDFPSIALFQDKTNALCKLRGVDKFHPVTKEDIQAFKRKREVWFVGRSKLQRERVKVK